MRTLLALFVLTAVTAALLLQLQIRHPLQATQGSDPETASFLSLRSAVFAAVTALSPYERRALASRDGSSFTELVLSDIGSFAENGFRIPGEDDGTPSLRAFLAMKGDTCLMAVFRTREDAALARALGSSAGTGSACRRFGIPRVLALAIARQESDSRPLLINIQGKDVLPRTPAEALRMAESCLARGLSFDVGLMQINSYWIRRYRIPLRRLFHPRDNIYVACFILAESMQRDGST